MSHTVNSIERIIHHSIGKYPFIRIPLVATYQRLFSFFPSTNYERTPLIAHLPGYFFGFHDKSPWSSDKTKILSHKFSVKRNITQIEKKPIEIGYFEHNKFDHFISIGTTNAWNWQQGSNLQWIGKTNKIFFNDLQNDNNVSRIYDINKGLCKTLQFHAMALSPDGRLALSASYQRFGKCMKGYGYKHQKNDLSIDNPLPPQEGLNLFSLDGMESKQIVDLSELANFDSTKSFSTSYHFISHCLFSPNSTRFVFFHRYLSKSGILSTRMFSSDIHSQSLWRFPGEDFSHISWVNDHRIFAYCKPPNRPLGFYFLDDLTGNIISVNDETLTSDGHPQVSSDHKYILIDTYPDRFRNQQLKIHDIEKEKSELVIRYKIPFAYRYHRRCDFHPRWSRDRKYICFDSAHNGVRSLCIVNSNLES
jgi:hypothetical protein